MNIDTKFKIQVEIDGGESNTAKLKILDLDGNVLDDEPLFTAIDISLRTDELVKLRAEMYGDHLKSKITTTVGTLAAFTDEELATEIERRVTERMHTGSFPSRGG